MAPNPSSPLAELARLVSWHRRKLAVLAAMSAAAIGITALSPEPAPTVSIVVADHRLAGGTRLSAADLTMREFPEATVPAEAVSDPDRLVGRTLIAPLSAGSVLTELSVLGDRPVVGDGDALVPIRVSDPAVVNLLQPGDRIDVLASRPGASPTEAGGSTQVVAEDVRIVTIPHGDETPGGFDTGGGDSRTLLLVEVARQQATALAEAGTSGQLTVLLRQ